MNTDIRSLRPRAFAATLALALLAAASSARAGVIYHDPYAAFSAVTDSLSYDGWNELNRPGLGCADTACSTALLVAGITANTWGSGDAVLTRTAGTMYPAGSGIYGGGTLVISDSTLAEGATSLVLQSFVNNFGAEYAPLLSYNGGSQALAATSVVTDGGYGTYTWDLSGLGDIGSYSLATTFDFAQVIAYQVDQVGPVPEPETWAMLLAGLAALGGAARRRAARSAQVRAYAR